VEENDFFGCVVCLLVLFIFQLTSPASAQESNINSQIVIDRSLLFQVRANQAKEEVQDGRQIHFVNRLPAGSLQGQGGPNEPNTPVSANPFSGCQISVCLGSICSGSGCLQSICLGSGCYDSWRVGSGCYVSNCLMSNCSASGCANSTCFQSGCETFCPPSGCATYCASCGGTACDSTCQQSICISTCPTQCGGGHNCQMMSPNP